MLLYPLLDLTALSNYFEPLLFIHNFYAMCWCTLLSHTVQEQDSRAGTSNRPLEQVLEQGLLTGPRRGAIKHGSPSKF